MSNLPYRPFDTLQIDTVLPTVDAPALIDLFSDTSYSYGLELTEAVETVNRPRRELPGNVVTIFIDIDAVTWPLIKGETKGKFDHRLIDSLWYSAAIYSISIWFERAPSDLNAADLPTMGGIAPLPARRCLSLEEIDNWIGEINAFLIETPNANDKVPF